MKSETLGSEKSITEQCNKLLISFSGGETSAYMTYELLKQFKGWKDMIVVFANTGEENEQTLEFVNKCDKHFGWNVVWVESVFNPEFRKGVKAKVVTFETASRNGEPFEAMIKKHGIPNIIYPHCSRELKKNAIRAYAKSIGWNKKDYQTAIGIRADEVDRVSEVKDKENLYYPLISFGTTKPFVNRFWRDMPFRLELKGYEGNCKVCWKKSLRKLMTIAKEHPEHFDNFKKWQMEFENFIPESQIAKRSSPIRFFRQNLTADDILELSRRSFEEPKDDAVNYKEVIQFGLFDLPLDLSNGCIESCEVF